MLHAGEDLVQFRLYYDWRLVGLLPKGSFTVDVASIEEIVKEITQASRHTAA
jgi:hypothetical protein